MVPPRPLTRGGLALLYFTAQDAAVGAAWAPLPYASTSDALAKVIAGEGVRGLYRGFGAVLFISPLASAAYFSGYETSKRLLAGTALEDRLGASGTYVAAGLVAQALAGCLFTPQDVVKERLQVQRIAARPAQGLIPATVTYTGSIDAVRAIVRAEGPRGLFRGYWAQNAAWWPWNVLYFVSYEHARDALAKASGLLGGKDALRPHESALCATVRVTCCNDDPRMSDSYATCISA